MESVVKNCGQTVHDEVANKQTMEELKELLKVGAPLGARGPGGEGRSHPSTRPVPFQAFADACRRVGARCGRGREGERW